MTSFRNPGSLSILMLIALAVRIAVPSGWMPSADRGIALTLCVGGDIETVWMDKDGSLHEQEPDQSIEHADCAFAGGAPAVDLPELAPASIIPIAKHRTKLPATTEASIGQGLAAPPPPATGPPALL